MKVLIRLDSLASPRTGIGYYTEYLTRELLTSPLLSVKGVFNGCLLEGEAFQPLLDDPGDAAGDRSARHLARQLAPLLRSMPGAYPLRQYYRDIRARRAVPAIDLYHEPNFIPFRFAGNTVVTVHDLSHLRHPEYHPVQRVRFLRRYLPGAIKKASAVITDSHFSASEIAYYFPETEGKVYPVHLGVEKTLARQSDDKIREVLSRYSLPVKSYILSIATLEPRKNIAGLVRAYHQLPSSLQAELPLVLVGGGGWQNDELRALLREHSGAGKIILTGRVARGDLAGLLSGARLFAYPSFYEGFGLPIAEARACGTPVLTTNYGAMAEVAGKHAFLVHPDQLAEGLSAALTSMPDEVEPFRYSWADTASGTIAVYNEYV